MLFVILKLDHGVAHKIEGAFVSCTGAFLPALLHSNPVVPQVHKACSPHGVFALVAFSAWKTLRSQLLISLRSLSSPLSEMPSLIILNSTLLSPAAILSPFPWRYSSSWRISTHIYLL